MPAPGDTRLAVARRYKRKVDRRSTEERIVDLEGRTEAPRAAARRSGKFSAREVRQDRERLELILADYAKLVGVTKNTIWAWEHGRIRPHRAQLENWLGVRNMPKAAAWRTLGKIATLKARLAQEARRFSAKAVRRERERLGLTLAEYAELVGTSLSTIYSWEHGDCRPLAAQLDRWLAVKYVSKEAAWKALGIGRISEFNARAVRAERKRLGLSAAKYARLVGVSMPTIYNWEKDVSVPRQDAVEKWRAVKGMSKEAAWKRLGIEEPAPFSGKAVLAERKRLGRVILAERKRLGFSVAKYARLLGVSKPTVYSWEKGATVPRGRPLERWLALKGIGKAKAERRLGLR